jgi:hypothetical protein
VSAAGELAGCVSARYSEARRGCSSGSGSCFNVDAILLNHVDFRRDGSRTALAGLLKDADESRNGQADEKEIPQEVS